MSEPRYAYDLEEGFFVDMGDPHPDDPTTGSEMYVTEVADRLNELEAKLSDAEGALHAARAAVQLMEELSVAVTRDGELQSVHLEAWADSIRHKNGYTGANIEVWLREIAVALAGGEEV